uniref:Uncharacterized protein n=1 Tax=Anguilla anguilla TaxID=7936 RepID=A0A0E9TR24_ANGAN
MVSFFMFLVLMLMFCNNMQFYILLTVIYSFHHWECNYFEVKIWEMNCFKPTQNVK